MANTKEQQIVEEKIEGKENIKSILDKREEVRREQIVRRMYANIPSFVFRDRSLSVLEVLVEYLKNHKKLSFHEIAILLNRDDRTIWTVYKRAMNKRKGK